MKKYITSILAVFITLCSMTSCKKNPSVEKDKSEIVEKSRSSLDVNVTEFPVGDQIKKSGPNFNKYIYVFRDMANSSSLDYYFVIFKNNILMKITSAPLKDSNDFKIIYYYSENVPEGLFAQRDPFFIQISEIKPPFLPEQYFTYRVDVTLNTDVISEPVFFKKDNYALNSWLKELNLYITSNGRQIEKLPSWILDDKRILTCIGEK